VKTMTETADNKAPAENQPLGMLSWLWLSTAVVILDQATKLWVVAVFEKYERLAVLPFFNLTLAHNEGAAFSFLAGAGGWQRWFFTAIAAVVSVVLIMWLRKLPKTDRLIAVALALILGGALGNLYDRVTLGYVVDFLDFYWQDYHFPAFNVADSAITVGAGLMILDMFIHPGKR